MRKRTDPGLVTGLALTVIFVAIVLVASIVAVLVYMIRTNSGVVGIDSSLATWSAANISGTPERILQAITQLGTTLTVVLVSIAAGIFGLLRWRRAAIPVFLALVVAGQAIISNLVKLAVDRTRPSLNPLTSFGGPSFPSGHSMAAAATYAGVAFVLALGVAPHWRATLSGIAVAIAVAVACSRVLLGVHWFSDAIAGLLLGWTWFGLVAVAYGGRALQFGALAKAASKSTRPSTQKAAERAKT
jgi:undecaprenyl-diphosphatase